VTDFCIVRLYPYPIATLWRAVTEPDLVARWTTTGRGGRPVGFVPVVGNRFQLVAKPLPGWRGIVDCEVIAAEEPHLLQYTWVGDEGGRTSLVTHRLDDVRNGTRLTFEHTGFSGVSGFLMAKLLYTVRRRMLAVGLPRVLADLDERGDLRAKQSDP
jgi:uncharacterized protein YndB with AHSA1/START domain